MGQMITVTGMVLAAYPYGDYDKRITILTKERGKITAFARGARRQNSPLLAVCNSFVGACYGFYFCELADYYTREANDELLMLKLLYQSLRALSRPSIPDELIRYIYELKVLVVNGECPVDFEGLDVCESTLYTLQYIAASSVEKLYTFTVSEQVLGELKFVLHRYRELYMEGHFKSLEILEACVKSG